MKIKQQVLNNKVTVSDEQTAIQTVNLLHGFITNSPKYFGIYKNYAKNDKEEILAHFEHELCEAAQYLDATNTVKLA